jgi:hypothetical protein
MNAKSSASLQISENLHSGSLRVAIENWIDMLDDVGAHV